MGLIKFFKELWNGPEPDDELELLDITEFKINTELLAATEHEKRMELGEELKLLGEVKKLNFETTERPPEKKPFCSGDTLVKGLFMVGATGLGILAERNGWLQPNWSKPERTLNLMK